MVQGRLRNLEKGKIFCDAKIRAAYGNIFKDWEEKDILKKVPLESPQVSHLLPHFPIL